jgi:hypothetical protein
MGCPHLFRFALELAYHSALKKAAIVLHLILARPSLALKTKSKTSSCAITPIQNQL